MSAQHSTKAKTKSLTIAQQLTAVKRELAHARRENGELHARLWTATKESERRLITSWHLSERFHQELQTLTLAGFVVEVMAYEDGSICTSAIKRVSA